jgi:hypothetical protein
MASDTTRPPSVLRFSFSSLCAGHKFLWPLFRRCTDGERQEFFCSRCAVALLACFHSENAGSEITLPEFYAPNFPAFLVDQKSLEIIARKN